MIMSHAVSATQPSHRSCYQAAQETVRAPTREEVEAKTLMVAIVAIAISVSYFTYALAAAFCGNPFPLAYSPLCSGLPLIFAFFYETVQSENLYRAEQQAYWARLEKV